MVEENITGTVRTEASETEVKVSGAPKDSIATLQHKHHSHLLRNDVNFTIILGADHGLTHADQDQSLPKILVVGAVGTAGTVGTKEKILTEAMMEEEI